MNYYEFNDKLLELSNNMYRNIDYVNISNQKVINMNEIYYEVGKFLPKTILYYLIIALTFFIIYYYIYPIWLKYFENYKHYSDLIFKSGLMFLCMAGLMLIIYTSGWSRSTLIINIGGYVLAFVGIYYFSRWLINRGLKKKGKELIE